MIEFFKPMQISCQLARQTPAELHPRVLQGAGYEILRRLDQELATVIHDNQNCNFGVQWNSCKRIFRLGFNSIQTSIALENLSTLTGQVLLLGNDKTLIETAEAQVPLFFDLKEKGRVEIRFQSPAILRKTERRPHLLPDLEWLCASAMRKANMQKSLLPSVLFDKFHVDCLKLESCDVEYGYQRETGLTGFCRWSFDGLTSEEQQSLTQVLQLIATIGVGSKTSMGFGTVQLQVAS